MDNATPPTQQFWGVIAKDGSQLDIGSGGWESTKPDTGIYQVTASPVDQFGSAVVLTSPYGDGSSIDNVFSVNDVTVHEDRSVSFTVLSSDVGNNTEKGWYYQDGSFTFHVIHTVTS